MLNNALHRFSLVLLLLVACVSIQVANAGISVTFLDYRLSATQNVNLGYTLTISAEVKNNDSTAFSGFLDFGLRNDNTDLSGESIFNKPPYSGRQIMLAPGEVVPAIFSVDINTPFFTPGPDVVVVWPISSAGIDDSILVHLLIETPNSVNEKKYDDFSYTVLNDHILLHYHSSYLTFKQVRILNIIGQPIAQFHANLAAEIPLPPIPKGIYLCEMLTTDNKYRVIKFFH